MISQEYVYVESSLEEKDVADENRVIRYLVNNRYAMGVAEMFGPTEWAAVQLLAGGSEAGELSAESVQRVIGSATLIRAGLPEGWTPEHRYTKFDGPLPKAAKS